MTENNKPIIHGEIVPVITLTRRQLEEDWYTLHQQLACKEQECGKLEASRKELYEFNKELINEKFKIQNEKIEAENKIEQIRDIANNYKNCNDVGHYVQNSEARYALWKVALAMRDILQIIDEVEDE